MFIEKVDKEKIKVEPYWNVNGIIYDILSHISDIKVEPYWNVNFQ